VKILAVYVCVLFGVLATAVSVQRTVMARFCWCWPPIRHSSSALRPPLERSEFQALGSYGVEVDWNTPERLLALDYNQDQGKRIFYQHCVWCHADVTPAGPSNRSNVMPVPPLLNDGNVLNGESDTNLRKIIAAGGSGVGKSAMMPPYGETLSSDEIDDVIEYIRVIAVPDYHPGSSLPKASQESKGV